MERQLEIFITNLDKKYIKNKVTGEVTNWCMVTYLIPKEENIKSKGCAQLSCYCKENAFTDLAIKQYKLIQRSANNTVGSSRKLLDEL